MPVNQGGSDFEMRVRTEAMSWLAARTHDGAEPISSTDLLDFTVDGERFRLMDQQRGIRKPAAFDAALAIRTTYTPPGRTRPYEDQIGEDGLVHYKWRGTDPDHPENRALRTAMHLNLPMIWFFGVGQAMYHPVYPVYILSENPADHEFVVDPDVAQGLITPGSPVEATLRRHIMRETKQRIHGPVFRSTVLRAYDTRCAVCALHHAELLDAAHIIPDSDERGIPVVRNGMAMCKIHHAAYDQRILGVRPDYVVQIRRDLLEEIDGPMLEHGLNRRHDQPLMVLPRTRKERPDADFLQERYEQFLAAG